MPSTLATNPAAILFATDFSEPSRRALLWVKKLALHWGAAVRSLHVIDLTEEAGRSEHSYAEARSSAEQMLREVRRELRLAGLSESALLIAAGKPVQAILGTANRDKVGLLAIGVNGRRSAQPSVGGTARILLESALCPVMTVGAGSPQHSGGKAVERVLRVSDTAPGSLRLARALWPQGEMRSPLICIARDQRELHTSSKLSRDDEPIQVVRAEDAAAAIVREAHDAQTELIVVARARSRQDAFSTAGWPYRLAATAPCPVVWARS